MPRSHQMHLETERLLIRSFQEADIPAYAEIVADPRVTRYLADGQAHSYEVAARAVLRYGLEELDLRGIVAVAYEANVASVRVIEKLGFRFTERTANEHGVMVWYAQPDEMDAGRRS